MKFFITCVFLTICHTHGARILGIFPPPAHSHYTVGFRLMKELALRGHEVTFISSFRQETPINNLREIELTGLTELMQNLRKEVNMFEMGNMLDFLSIMLIGSKTAEWSEYTLQHENVQRLLKSKNETFDLVIKEQFLDDALLGFAHHFQAPVILLSAIGSSMWTNGLVGNPAPPSYVPNKLLSYQPKMTFIQRTYNALINSFQEIYNHLHLFPKHDNILHKYFPTAPHIYDLMHNISLIFLNSHVSFDPAVPHVPSMVEIGGYHVEPPRKLPGDLQNFLDQSKEGVIYFSMGSNLNSKDLPPQKVQAILKVFSQMSLKVLWKWEDDKSPGLPSNVRIEKWLPQQDILAHPNVKIFITHGGLLSTIEAIYHGVPVIGIPIFGDQKANMANAVDNGYAVLLPYKELSEQSLALALNEIIYNPKYTDNARKRSQIMHDRLVKPIDEAVYWVNYVLKHKGAHHLKTAAIDLTWYQYILLDVILFLTLIVVIFSTLISFLIKTVLRRKKKSKEKSG